MSEDGDNTRCSKNISLKRFKYSNNFFALFASRHLLSSLVCLQRITRNNMSHLVLCCLVYLIFLDVAATNHQFIVFFFTMPVLTEHSSFQLSMNHHLRLPFHHLFDYEVLYSQDIQNQKRSLNLYNKRHSYINAHSFLVT